MDRNPSRSSSEDAALCDFLLLLRADESTGTARPLAEYLGRFPGLDVEIAREYLAHLDRGQGARTAPPRAPERRYEPGEVIGRGGMGEVRRARDLRLDRELAMKTLRRLGPRARRRFLREASITGRLDHPGVVPVHDLGVGDGGQPFFTMKHVEGIDLDEVFERVRHGDPEWSLARALEVLIKVCDTVAFAHSRGVIHRDLKPSNVRVGRFGEVYVMDWGLARVVGEEYPDADDDGGDAALPDLTSLTLDGDVLGTPAYMAPEQAEGHNATIDETVDVYSVGAMLYQLLSGRQPYAPDGARDREHHTARGVLELVRTRPPAKLRATRGSAPVELVAICEKAMARRRKERYPRMEAVARDFRAFLDLRIVSAYDPSALERALKWARRHRPLVASVLLISLIGALGALFVHRDRMEAQQRLLQLSRSQLVTWFDTLWPPQPANEKALAQWLHDAEDVLATRAQDLAALEELKREALPMDPDAPAERAERARLATQVRRREAVIDYYARLAERIERGEKPPKGQDLQWVRAQVPNNRAVLERERLEQPGHLTFRFASDADQIRFEALTELVSEQEKILGTPGRPSLIELARFGLEAARRVERDSLVAPRLDWERARCSIADRAECPQYGGLALAPQLGLVPVGRDPASELWEFAHVLSGEVPARDPDGRLVIDERSAIVLVLIPGGTVLRGSQRDDPTAPNYDPWSDADAPLAEEAELRPFFVSKFELTRAQWARVTGREPHAHNPELEWPTGPLCPVSDVDFEDAKRVLAVLGLDLPTEAQWEWAQRAGTDTPWSSGNEPQSIAGHANIVGRVILREELDYEHEPEVLPDFDDGFVGESPVGSFLPNAFGLHDMMGNVREWCRDTGPYEYVFTLPRVETGERVFREEGTRVARGGSFARSVLRCRSAARDQVGPLLHAADLGIRPARDIDR